MVFTTALSDAVTDYFKENGRALPWRSTPPNPYHVWISEIMLQQTRIEAVIPYFNRFIKRAPTVNALAALSEEELFKLWEGLGYYSRAKNLLKTAQLLVVEHAGMLPSNYTTLLSLPGIGPYTAGAIASIAFSLPEPAVDGNVLRVLARLFAYEKNVLEDKAKKLFYDVLKKAYPKSDPAALTQGLMEIGQTICLPKNPRCNSCPISFACKALKENKTNIIPLRKKDKTKRLEEKTVFLIYDTEGRLAIEKRPDTGLLSGLYGLPSHPEPLSAAMLPEVLSDLGGFDLLRKKTAVHIFTHVRWEMTGYYLKVKTIPDRFIAATWQELSTTYALPTAFKKLLPESPL